MKAQDHPGVTIISTQRLQRDEQSGPPAENYR